MFFVILAILCGVMALACAVAIIGYAVTQNRAGKQMNPMYVSTTGLIGAGLAVMCIILLTEV